MYSVEAAFLPKFIFLLAIPLFLLFLFRKIMGKWLKVEKRKSSSYNHANEKHKKVDWTIRFTFLFLTLLAFLIDFMISPMDTIWFLQPWVFLLFFIVVSEIVRAIMERKYAENPNDYKLTVSQLLFVLILVVIWVSTYFFGLF